MAVHIMVAAGEANPPDNRPASVKAHTPVSERQVAETLRQIGLEYGTADYLPTRPVTITIIPIDTEQQVLRNAIRTAMTELERV
jgi:hypothetical protein